MSAYDPERTVNERRELIRRRFVLAGAAVAAMGFRGALAQRAPANRISRVGYLAASVGNEASHLIAAFRQGLRELGYVEGQNITLEFRSAENRADRYPVLAAELVAQKVDVIVAGATPAAPAAKKATGTIPIVFPIHIDPVGAGLVASLQRPGGNVTGLSYSSEALIGKRLELLKDIVPRMSRIAVLRNSAIAATLVQLKTAEELTRTLGLRVQILEIRDADDLEKAFRAAIDRHSQALLVLDDPGTFLLRKRIVELAAKNRLPAMYGPREFAVDGGLIAYGADIEDMFRRTAGYVDKILKGAKPADLPVEQPTKFEFIINMQTAKALGIRIPRDVLVRADRVIQ